MKRSSAENAYPEKRKTTVFTISKQKIYEHLSTRCALSRVKRIRQEKATYSKQFEKENT